MSRKPVTASTKSGNAADDAKRGDGGTGDVEGANRVAENGSDKPADKAQSSAGTGWGADAPTVTDPNTATIAGANTDPITFAGANIDPGTLSPGDTPTRKRGRPPGSKAKSPPADISGIEKLLLSIHTMMARAVPEMEMDATEAHEIAAAYADVSNYYPIMRLPGNVTAITTFATLIGASYGGRLMAIRLRKQMENAGGQPRNVTPRPQARPAQAPFAMPDQSMPQPPVPEQKINGVDYAASRPDVPEELRHVQIPGVGEVVFPPDHPLISGKRN